jgi:hypothetical protein
MMAVKSELECKTKVPFYQPEPETVEEQETGIELTG